MPKKLSPAGESFEHLLPDLMLLSKSKKYENTTLSSLFDQRFYFQPNKPQMFINESLDGFTITVSGNELEISKALYENENVAVINSMEMLSYVANVIDNYDPDIFSSVAYLICPNKIFISIDGQLDEPIYVHYKTEFECFYNSVITFDIISGAEIDIIEEIESNAALNCVTNYKVGVGANLNLYSFCKNTLSGSSMVYRKVDLEENANYTHIMLANGSYTAIDENQLNLGKNSQVELLGVINSRNKNFNTILNVTPDAQEHYLSSVYKTIKYKNDHVGFDVESEEINNININNFEINYDNTDKVKQFIFDIVDRAILTSMTGYKRFYINKDIFLQFLFE